MGRPGILDLPVELLQHIVKFLSLKGTVPTLGYVRYGTYRTGTVPTGAGMDPYRTKFGNFC